MSKHNKEIRSIRDIPGVGSTIADKLEAAGYTTPWAIVVSRAEELAEKAGIPLHTAERIIANARKLLGIRFKTAKEVKLERLSVRKITTGSKNLDDLLGGGIETKTITEFYGEYGTGKCFSKDTLVYYENDEAVHLSTIEEMYEYYRARNGEIPFDDGYVVPLNTVHVYAIDPNSIDIKRVKAKYIYREYTKKLVNLKLENGLELKVTPRHPVLVFDDGFRWLPAGSLKPGMLLVGVRRLPANNMRIDYLEAYVLGLFVAEGTANPLSITTKSDEIAKTVVEFVKRRDGYTPRISVDKRNGVYKILLRKKSLKWLGDLAKTNARTKHVPSKILNGDIESIEWFLAGYIDGDGYVNNIEIVLSTRSKKLAAGLVFLLKKLGIRPSINTKIVRREPFYIIRVTGEDRFHMNSVLAKTLHKKTSFRRRGVGKYPPEIAKFLAKYYKELRLPKRDRETAYHLLTRNLNNWFTEKTLLQIRSYFEEALKMLEEAEKNIHPGLKLRLPFPWTRLVKYGFKISQIRNYRYRGLPVSEETFLKVSEALKAEIRKLKNMVSNVIRFIDKIQELEFYRVVDVKIINYNDWVYDLVVPEVHNFISPHGVILHNTQICHQLSVNVQLPPERGGLNGKAVYIDTEGTFRWERIEAMARGMNLDPDEIMENIFYQRAYNSDHQMAIVEELFSFVPENNVKLVIIDSVTSHFRAEYPGRENLAMRQQKLNKHLHQLVRLAEAYNIAVVVTNQVMARPDVFYGDPTQAVGGHVLAHTPGVRVQLRRAKGNKRIARVVDAPHLPEGEAVFLITDEGIRDPEE